MPPETATATPQRTLPHNLEAERSVLGAILIDNDTFNIAAAMIDSKAFFRDAHRRIFDRMLDLSERSQPIDLVTLKEELERAGDLEEVGGPAYVASLVDGVPRSTNVEYYAQIVKEKATLRNLIFSANKILGTAYEADQEADLILDEAESAIFAVAEDRIKSGFVSMSTLVRESFPKIERLFEHKTFITGVPTGFDDIDRKTRGLQAGDLVIVAARPSMGKTSLVLNICQHVATHGGVAGFFSLEMSKESLFMRMLASEAKIDMYRLMSGQIGQKEYGQIMHAMETLGEARLFVDDTAGIGALEMRAKARRLKAEHWPVRDRDRLYPVDDGPRPLREPHARTGVDLAIAQGPRQGTGSADHRAVAAVARARSALRQAPDAVGPARIRRPRTGRRRRHADLPRGDVQGRRSAGGYRRHRRNHRRQAAQWPDRHRQARLHPRADTVRQSREQWFHAG